MKVEAGLADADNFWVVGQGEKLVGEQRRVIGSLMRMRPDGAPYIIIGLGDRPHLVELVEPRAYREHRFDTGGPGTGDHGASLCREIREVEMAMAVDQHLRASTRHFRESGSSGHRLLRCIPWTPAFAGAT